ncbi:MAG TPA: DUF4136 domain-containing protein [Terriglobia bacterium]
MKTLRMAFSLCFLLTAGSAFGQKVNVDWDKTANFSSFKTYAWAKGTPSPNQLVDQRITNAIDAQLAAKGLQKLDAGANPDLAVTYAAAVGAQTQLNTTTLGGWGGPWRYGWGGGTSTTSVQQIPVGQLVVELGDIKNKDLVWRATSSDTMSDNPQKNEKKINKAVEKMFKKYPPPKGK